VKGRVVVGAEAARSAKRRTAWAAEAQVEMCTLLKTARGPGAERARAVLRLARSLATPRNWAVSAAIEAFLLPRAVPECGMETGTMTGLMAAASWMLAKGAPTADAFAERVEAMRGLVVLDLQGSV